MPQLVYEPNIQHTNTNDDGKEYDKFYSHGGQDLHTQIQIRKRTMTLPTLLVTIYHQVIVYTILS
jgi:hypothetical protein